KCNQLFTCDLERLETTEEPFGVRRGKLTHLIALPNNGNNIVVTVEDEQKIVARDDRANASIYRYDSEHSIAAIAGDFPGIAYATNIDEFGSIALLDVIQQKHKGFFSIDNTIAFLSVLGEIIGVAAKSERPRLFSESGYDHLAEYALVRRDSKDRLLQPISQID